MDTSLDMINKDLESIKQDYLNLIEQIDKVTDIKTELDESVIVNGTNLKVYRDNIGIFLTNKIKGDVEVANKTETLKSQITDATKKLETRTEEYNRLKNKNNVNAKSLVIDMNDADSLEYHFNLQFNLFIGLVILICMLYFVTSNQIDSQTGLILIILGLFLMFSYYCYKK